MKHLLILTTLVCLTACYVESVVVDDATLEQRRVEEDLADVIEPVAEDYFEYCRKMEFDNIFSCYSTQLKKKYNEQGLKKLMVAQKDAIKLLGNTAVVTSVKPFKKIYAIVTIDSSQGKEYWGMIDEKGEWKIHLTSKNWGLLIRSLP
jgi:hypothetical protein